MANCSTELETRQGQVWQREAQSKQDIFAVTASRCLALQTVLDLRLLAKECVAEAAAEAERQRGHGESIFSLELLSVRGESGPSCSTQAPCPASYAILLQQALHVAHSEGLRSDLLSAVLCLLTSEHVGSICLCSALCFPRPTDMHA